MGWKKYRKKFRRRIKKLGKNIIPIAAVVGGMIPVVGGIVSMMANAKMEKDMGFLPEEEAQANLPALPTSAAGQEVARTTAESFPFTLPGVGPLLKQLFG